VTSRYLVFECGEVKGLGDILISIMNLAYYATRWGRTLALDLRNFQYINKDPHVQFFKNFKLLVPENLSITTDLDVIDTLYSHTSYKLVTGKQDISIARDFEEEVVIAGQTFACDHLYRPKDKLYPPQYRVELIGGLKVKVKNKFSNYSWKNSIGVHFRHGNGEFLIKRFDPVKSADFEKEYASLKQKYVDRVNQILRRVVDHQFNVFVTGDNQEFVSELENRIPNAVSLASELPDQPYQKHLQAHRQKPSILENAVVDLWTLSACSYLVCGESLFTDFALLNSYKLTPEHMFVITDFSLESLLESGSLEDALLATRKAIARVPNNMKLLRIMATALSHSGAHVEAQDLREKISHYERHTRYRPIFIDILIRHGQIEKAIDALRCTKNTWQDMAQQQALLTSLLARVERDSGDST